jgi:hypothetical protein
MYQKIEQTAYKTESCIAKMEEQGLFKAPVANHQTGRSYIPTESDICV